MKKIIAILASLLLPVTAFGAVQVIVLNVNDAGSNNVSYQYLCWLTISNPVANPNFVSEWKASGSSAGPNSSQISALQAGTIKEESYSLTVSSTTPVSTVESDIISFCSTRQSYLNGIPGPGIYYGYTWGGSAWILQ